MELMNKSEFAVINNEVKDQMINCIEKARENEDSVGGIIETAVLNPNDILIVGDRHRIIEYAVESGIKLLIISSDAEIKEKHIEIAKQNKVNI